MTTLRRNGSGRLTTSSTAPTSRRAEAACSTCSRPLPDRCYENALPIADGDYVMLHGRLSSTGPQANRSIARLQDGLIAEHWDVVQDEATAEESKRGLPMNGDTMLPQA